MPRRLGYGSALRRVRPDDDGDLDLGRPGGGGGGDLPGEDQDPGRYNPDGDEVTDTTDIEPRDPSDPLDGLQPPMQPFDWDRVDRARKMRSFYEDGFFGSNSTYDNPMSAASFVIKNAPEGASMQDLFGGPFGFWAAQNASGPARDFSDMPPPTMGGFSYGSPFGPPPLRDNGNIYGDAMRMVHYRRLNEGPQPGEFLSGYGVGQLNRYGVGSLQNYGVGALNRRR